MGMGHRALHGAAGILVKMVRIGANRKSNYPGKYCSAVCHSGSDLPGLLGKGEVESMEERNGQFADASKAFQMHDRSAISVILLIVPLIAGCAQIKFFSVAPSTVCPGETVEIDWEASGKVALSAAPPLEGTGEGPAEGSRSFTPTQSTRFVLKAPGLLKSDQREWDVQVIPRQSSRLLGGIAQCGGNPPSVSTSFTIQQKDT